MDSGKHETPVDDPHTVLILVSGTDVNAAANSILGHDATYMYTTRHY